MILVTRLVEISLHMWEDAEHYGTTDQEITRMVLEILGGSTSNGIGAASVGTKTVGLYAWEVSE